MSRGDNPTTLAIGEPLRVLYISQLAEPDCHDLSVYRGLADGAEDIAWFRARVHERGLGQDVAIEGVNICVGEPLPDPASFDAVVLGGSYHMVAEQRPWQREALRWLAQARQVGRPVFGICGGHQLMSTVFGANVSRLPGGVWGETATVRLTEQGIGHWLFHGVAPSTGYHFGNFEHVETVPDGAVSLAVRRDSPAVALDFGDGWVSVQFHPEMSAESMVASWRQSEPRRVQRYWPSPGAARLIANFLVHAGLGSPHVAGSQGA